jgi:hypothetical protein
MNNQLFPSTIEMISRGNKIKVINKDIMNLIRKLGGKVVNSSYVLVDGTAREAYGYYRFPNVGAVMTSLSFSEDLRCNFSMKFLGFEKERNKFNKIKTHIEEALRRSGLNSVQKK